MRLTIFVALLVVGVTFGAYSFGRMSQLTDDAVTFKELREINDKLKESSERLQAADAELKRSDQRLKDAADGCLSMLERANRAMDNASVQLRSDRATMNRCSVVLEGKR